MFLQLTLYYSQKSSDNLRVVFLLCRIASEGKVCMIDAESVESVVSMRRSLPKATYIHLRQPERLVQTRLHSQDANETPSECNTIGVNADHMEHTENEPQVANKPNIWDFDITLPEDPDAAYYHLMAVAADRFSAVIPRCHVWGLGRQLWDTSCRIHGRHPVRVHVLGPPAVGKTTVAMKIAERFGLPHINAGDLLFNEVSKFPLTASV